MVTSLAGAPLNGVQLQRAVVEGDPRLEVGALSQKNAGEYASAILPYLHYLCTPLDNRVGVEHRFRRNLCLVPLGSSEPKVFQRKYPLDCEFTRSVRAFYPVLESRQGGLP